MFRHVRRHGYSRALQADDYSPDDYSFELPRGKIRAFEKALALVCVDICVDMRTDMRRACAAHRWQSSRRGGSDILVMAT